MSGEFALLLIESIMDDLELDFVKEFQFNSERKWRFDYYIKKHNLAIEYHGGQFTKGRHVRPVGYGGDLFKMNAAQIMGFKVLQFTTEHISPDGNYIKSAIQAAAAPNVGKFDDVFRYGIGTNTNLRNMFKPRKGAKRK